MADEKRPVGAKPTNDIVAQVAERVRTGDNVLIALSRDPSVDELSAAIGLTFLLDKMGKHATAIFSGAVPNAIEFLEPEKTFETNTNSLQDFIIALDKEKADHLRYKIDGDYVKVYITPYKTTIDEGDLEFSHGDFNVDLVIALGVGSMEDLDKALTEYGRIMHDASSINISVEVPGKFGDLQWSDPAASAVSEMICGLAERLKDKENLLDKPIATALLAGIVAATSRFSNERTTPATMSVASKLMEAGADQQLISSSIPVDGVLKVADADTGMPVEGDEAVVAEGEPKSDGVKVVEEVQAEAAPADDADVSRLQVQHEGEDDGSKSEEPKDESGAVDGAPEVKLEKAEETPEQQLEKIIQMQPPAESGGPLMDELRGAAVDGGILEPEHEKVLEPLDDTEREPQKDYASLMEQELKTPPVTQENVAVQAAPEVPSTVEINGIPAIDYGQAGDTNQEVSAPVMNAEPVAGVVPVEAVAVPVTNVEPAVSDLPMPGAGAGAEFLPPPPPPFDPGTAMGAVDFSPTPELPPVPEAVSAAAVPVQPVAPIVSAAPEAAPGETSTYMGSNPAMQDQVYPPVSNDPSAFQLPTPTA